MVLCSLFFLVPTSLVKLLNKKASVLSKVQKDFSTPCLLKSHQYMVRGNGVPLEMGRVVAKCIKDNLDNVYG